MFQELSKKVDKLSYNKAVTLTMKLYSACADNDAWNSTNGERFQNCNKEISRSNYLIQKNFHEIKFFSTIGIKDTLIQSGWEQVKEEIDLRGRYFANIAQKCPKR